MLLDQAALSRALGYALQTEVCSSGMADRINCLGLVVLLHPPGISRVLRGWVSEPLYLWRQRAPVNLKEHYGWTAAHAASALGRLLSAQLELHPSAAFLGRIPAATSQWLVQYI